MFSLATGTLAIPNPVIPNTNFLTIAVYIQGFGIVEFEIRGFGIMGFGIAIPQMPWPQLASNCLHTTVLAMLSNVTAS